MVPSPRDDSLFVPSRTAEHEGTFGTFAPFADDDRLPRRLAEAFAMRVYEPPHAERAMRRSWG
jgi:hypothetical protein